MKEIDVFIEKLDAEQTKIAKQLRALILDNFPELEEIYSWKMPVYTHKGNKIVYLQSSKPGINLGFNEGANIHEPKELFQGGGKSMRHIKVLSLKDIDETYFKKLLGLAIKNAD